MTVKRLLALFLAAALLALSLAGCGDKNTGEKDTAADSESMTDTAADNAADTEAVTQGTSDILFRCTQLISDSCIKEIHAKVE